MLGSKLDIKEWSASSVQFLGLLSTLCVLIAIAHLVGFFSLIDLNLISYLTIQDVATHTLSYLPHALFSIFVPSAVGFLFAIVSPSTIGPQNRHPVVSLAHSIMFVIFIFMAAIALLSAFFSRNWTYWLFNSVMALGFAKYFAEKTSRWSSLRIQKSLLSVFLITLLLLLPAYQGQQDAAKLLTAKLPNARIVIGADIKDVTLIMASSDVIIYRDDPRTIKIVPRSRIDEITWFDVAPPPTSTDDGLGALLYRWFKPRSDSSISYPR